MFKKAPHVHHSFDMKYKYTGAGELIRANILTYQYIYIYIYIYTYLYIYTYTGSGNET
jgi:hypothetical protein